MGKQENDVQAAIEQACQVYSVPCFREQSRVVTIGDRPVFYGKWRDALGVWHSCGKADYLLTPQITSAVMGGAPVGELREGKVFGIREVGRIAVVVPLWVEAKAGKERAAKPNRCMCGDTALDHQEHFRKYVTGAGSYHLLVRDSAEILVQWFRDHGVIK